MLQRTRERLVLVLIAALPFHAFLVSVLTKLIAGPGSAPLPILALWKEALLGVILLIAVVEWTAKLRMKNEELRMDVLDLCILGLVLWSLIQFIILHSSFSIPHYAFGFKYDFLPLVAFLVLRRVPWSSSFISSGGAVLLGAGVIVAVYGMATMFLPMSWFTWLGYSDRHSLYVPGGPLAAFQQIESIGIRRMQSTFSGPNQMGLWMLIPWSLALTMAFRGKAFSFQLSAFSFLIAIVFSFSRSAWIAAAVVSAIIAWKHLPRKHVLLATCFLLLLATIAVVAFPHVILRATSSAGHIERPLQALMTMKEHPWGLGLGTAGPASNRFSDTCVELPSGSDASWASAHPDLCVFVGGVQVQPAGQSCQCPLLPENWYLQMGVELGWIGFVLYLGFVVLILKKLAAVSCQLSAFLMFLGISIAALFLHAWEDSAVAYTVWILLAVVLTPRQTHPLNP
ncbi:hypothetical protein FJZ27_01640 [Candidatus Peribacteria bacterium]|nr:hypothetical protein [Candidatus Peribacteria bacterium]